MLWTHNQLNMKSILLLVSAFLILGCSKASQDSGQEKTDVLSDFLSSKSTWEEAKSSLSLYEIETGGCGMTACYQAIVLFNAQTSTAISCTEKVSDFQSQALVIRDCMGDSYYMKTVEDYFKEFESIMVSGAIQRYAFDPAYGVPTLVVGTQDDDMADSSAPGFYIKFTVR